MRHDIRGKEYTAMTLTHKKSNGIQLPLPHTENKTQTLR
jgi:hypothetical protein